MRYGYRRVHVLLRRKGWAINQKKTRRVYRELGLQLRNKTPKRRVQAKLRDDRRPATRSNETWAMDFVHDQLATGQKLRVLTIVDTFSRFSPALEPRFTFRGADVVEVLERVGRKVGLPAGSPAGVLFQNLNDLLFGESGLTGAHVPMETVSTQMRGHSRGAGHLLLTC